MTQEVSPLRNHAARGRCSKTGLRPPRPGGILAAMPQCWLVKSEPESYSWNAFVKEGRAAWTGIRNFQARNNLRAMQRGDLVLYYHSVSDKQVVGLARVTRVAYPDPTADEGDWSCVDLEPVKPLAAPVSLDQIKADAALKEMPLLKHSRLSVQPVNAAQFKRVLELGGTKA